MRFIGHARAVSTDGPTLHGCTDCDNDRALVDGVAVDEPYIRRQGSPGAPTWAADHYR
jgi:hypothetical protein